MLIRFCRKGWQHYGLPVASVAIATGLPSKDGAILVDEALKPEKRIYYESVFN